jgi:hypothetical protein
MCESTFNVLAQLSQTGSHPCIVSVCGKNTPLVTPSLTDVTDFTFTFTEHQPLVSAACSVYVSVSPS